MYNVKETKKGLLAKIHIGKKQLRFDEDTYRDFLYLHTKKTSCKDMNIKELEIILIVMKQAGFKPKKTNKTTAPTFFKIKHLLKLNKKPLTYAEKIAQHMFKQSLKHLNIKQLQAVLTAIRKHHEKH